MGLLVLPISRGPEAKPGHFRAKSRGGPEHLRIGLVLVLAVDFRPEKVQICEVAEGLQHHFLQTGDLFGRA